MKLNKREMILAGLVGLIVLVYVGNLAFRQILQGPLDARRDRVAKLKREIDQKQKGLRRARAAGEKLARWQQQSLPSETEVARSQYQNWLLEIVGRAGFEKPNVDSGETLTKKGLYQRLPFSVRGRGNLAQLTRFLYDFYRADHLHQLQRLSITPIPKTQELELAISIEALILPGATRKDRLNTDRSDRLAWSGLAEYQPIVDRNVFGEGGISVFDAADFAFLTAILEIDGQPEAWFTVRTTGEILKLRKGQSFEVGQFRGTVAAIDPQDLVIEADEERWLLTLGENLSQATALPPEF